MKEKLKALLAEFEQKDTELTALRAKGAEATDDEVKAAVALDAELDGLQAKITDVKAVVAAEGKAASRQAFLQANAVNAIAQPPASESKVAGAADDIEIKAVPVHYGGEAEHFLGSREERRLKAYQFGRWFFAGMFGHGKSVEYCHKAGIELKVQTEGVATAGGVLVPPQFSPDVISLIKEYGVARPNLGYRRMTSDEINVPRRVSGPPAYWGTEGGSMTGGSKASDMVTLHAKKLYCLPSFSSELAEDAIIDVANDLAQEIALAFAKAEDEAAFIGDGSATYGGILGVIEAIKKTVTDAGGTWATDGNKVYNPSVVAASGNAFSEVTMADLTGTQAAAQRYRGPATNAWFCHSAFYYGVMQRLALAQGGATSQEAIAGMTAGVPRFLGWPVIFTEVMISQEAASGVPLVGGALGLAGTFGDRTSLALAQSADYAFNQDVITMRGTERVDIQFHDVGTANSSAASRAKGPACLLALLNA